MPELFLFDLWCCAVFTVLFAIGLVDKLIRSRRRIAPDGGSVIRDITLAEALGGEDRHA